MARRSYNGGAVPSLTTTLLNPGGLTVGISPDTNWPTGGAAGEFNVIINPGLPTEEHALAQSLSGGTITFASAGKRGVDGTSAQTHPVGSVIIHGDAAYEADEANRHINDSAQAEIEHSGLLNAARHAAVTHTAAMLGTDSVGSDEIQANAVGSSELADNAVDTNAIVNLAVTTGKLADLSVTAAKIANDTITSVQIGTNAISQTELADNAVDTAAIVDNAVTLVKMADNSVGTSEIVTAAVTMAKIASEASLTYTATDFCNGGTFALGTGGTSYGHYFKFGRIVVAFAGFAMAADGNIVGTLTTPLPVAMRTVSDGQRGFAAARAQGGGANVFSGTGVVLASATQVNNIFTAGAGAAWDTTTPFNWGTGGVGACNYDSVVIYEAAT